MKYKIGDMYWCQNYPDMLFIVGKSGPEGNEFTLYYTQIPASDWDPITGERYKENKDMVWVPYGCILSDRVIENYGFEFIGRFPE